jgi:hypothetical protein
VGAHADAPRAARDARRDGALRVARLTIPPGFRYEDRKRELAPFDRIVVVDEAQRADVLALVGACLETVATCS